jgi:hypothetical protein
LLLLGQQECKKSTGRPTTRTLGLQKKVKRLLKTHTPNQIASKLNKSRRTIHRVKADLKLKVTN